MSFGTVAASYLSVASHTEHTIYGDATPGTVIVSDEGSTISLAASFYRYTSVTDGWRVVGGRLYVPTGTLGSLPATATMFWFHDTFHATAQLSTRTYEESKIVTLVEGWNNVYWTDPYTMGAEGTERVWIGYTLGNAKILYVTDTLPYDIEASDGSAIKFANADDSPARSAFTIAGSDNQANNPYGIDIIFDEGV